MRHESGGYGNRRNKKPPGTVTCWLRSGPAGPGWPRYDLLTRPWPSYDGKDFNAMTPLLEHLLATIEDMPVGTMRYMLLSMGSCLVLKSGPDQYHAVKLTGMN